MICMCNFHVLSHLLLIYICKLHWNRQATTAKALLQQMRALGMEDNSLANSTFLPSLFPGSQQRHSQQGIDMSLSAKSIGADSDVDTDRIEGRLDSDDDEEEE